MPKPDGYPVVLTADRTLMADYRILLDGMLAASQTTATPLAVMGGFLMPRGRTADGARALAAPLGLRRIEAALLDGGFAPCDVAVVDPFHLHLAIGPATRVVAVSSGEPAGLGMNSSTITAIAGGRIYPQELFRRLMNDVRRLVQNRAPGARVVMGGPGAWQIAANTGLMAELGIDHVVSGYAEANAARIFDALLRGGELPAFVDGEAPAAAAVPRVRGACTMGVVEISRGCGLGCAFCTIGRVPLAHLPEETIAADVQTNVAAGVRSIALLSEDFFRYGASGVKTDPAAVKSLLRRVRGIEGLRMIQIDHANVSSIAQYSDADLAEIRELLKVSENHRWLWVNVGVETASGRLLKKNGGGAKMGGCAPGEWGELCAAQLRRLCRAGFFPMASLVLGLPGETADDLRATLDWVRRLHGESISIFPMLHAPISGAPNAPAFSREHWRIIKACYRLNFKWLPRVYWDNQRAAGVGLPRRCVAQVLGCAQALEWRALFAIRSMRARR